MRALLFDHRYDGNGKWGNWIVDNNGVRRQTGKRSLAAQSDLPARVALPVAVFNQVTVMEDFPTVPNSEFAHVVFSTYILITSLCTGRRELFLPKYIIWGVGNW